MSIEVAIAWARSKIRNPRAIADAVAFFEKADREVQRATLLLSDRLTRDRKGWLGRWTGHEFVAAELSPHHQRGLGIKAGAMCREPEEFAEGRPPHSQLLTLSGITMAGVHEISNTAIVLVEFKPQASS